MGISIILIPMFGSSSRISDNEFTNSFYTVSLGVVIMMASVFVLTQELEYLAYFITIVAILLYLYQLYKMTSSRKKITHDIWARSMYVAFSSFIIAFTILILYLFNQDELYLRVGMWLIFVGFFGFIIIGNFYKVIPFLVWFHIYSPLIEERTVPMLHELVPKHLSNLQWFYATFGLIISSIGLYKENYHIFTGGVVLLSIAAFIFLAIINQILNSE